MPSSDQSDVGLEPERLAQPGPGASAQGACTRAAERRQDADPPVADLVAEALDDDVRSVGSAPVAASCSRRYVSRFLAAQPSSACSSPSRSSAFRP